MGAIWSHPYTITIGYFLLAIILIGLALFVFELITSYRSWTQIKQGNLAVALATGGKIFGTANVLRYSIQHKDTIIQSVLWGVFGIGMLLLAYFVFEFLTPQFKVDQELERDNRAIGMLSLMISIGVSYVIGASIT